MQAFLHFAHVRERMEAAEKLALDALAARGGPKELQKAYKDLQK